MTDDPVVNKGSIPDRISVEIVCPTCNTWHPYKCLVSGKDVHACDCGQDITINGKVNKQTNKTVLRIEGGTFIV